MEFDTLMKILFKVVVRAEILLRGFLQTPGNYYLPLTTIAKIQRLRKFQR